MATKMSSENITILFLPPGDYFNLLNFYKNSELSSNQNGRHGVQVKKENEKFTVVCSRYPKNLEFGHFTLLFCKESEKMYQNVKDMCRAIVFAH